MGAATRESTASAIRSLEHVLHPGLLGRLRGEPTSLGDELLAAARIVGGSRQLTSLLADPTIDAGGRGGLVRKLFGPAFDKRTVQLIEDMTASRWSETTDLVDALEEVGIRALAVTADDEPIDAELFRLREIMSGEPEVELALGNAASPAESRVALVDRLLVNASPATRSIARHIVQLPRGRRPIEALEHAERIVADARGRMVATAHVAKLLTDEQLRALEERLATGYGRKIAVNQVLDPAVLGGVRISIGDDVIDGTVRSRLDDLRLRLVG
jgi:F-type H+-transporting ATPase subunit delta